ncbi:DUF1284 domain-containing protein [Metabacillus fastidiosus]|uniref:DUF1284 domain-containing protein n=1 Tax=Metabacillus fastidiosus TaxID=1458 RepID=UPI003D2DE81F
MYKRMLRGHHLLCVHGFEGMGYSPAFIEKMAEIVDEIRDETLDYRIKVVKGLDETCFCCPHKGDGFCNSPMSDSIVTNLDQNVLTHLGLKSGEIYKKSELVSKVAKLVEPEDLDFLCEGCSWLSYGVCKKGISTLKRKML